VYLGKDFNGGKNSRHCVCVEVSVCVRVKLRPYDKLLVLDLEGKYLPGT
jgi:hypothetical protein